jgi:hypothetical protein
MIAVAVVAIAIGGFLGITKVSKRAEDLRRKARAYAHRAEAMRKSVQSKLRAARGCEAYGGDRMLRIALEYRVEAKFCVKQAEYLDRLSRKYEHAAFYPWLPLGPDPPGPDWDRLSREYRREVEAGLP